MLFPNTDRRPWLFLILLLTVGMVSTLAWLGGAKFPDTERETLVAATLAVCATTLINLAVRWFRWHFLLRTLRIRLRARESALIFTSLLPMVLTPWAIGELLFAIALRRRVANPLRAAGLTWLVSRGADAFSLLLVLFLSQRGLLAAAVSLFLFSTLGLAMMERRGGFWAQGFRFYLFLGLSVIAWTCAASGLFTAQTILGGGASWPESLNAFAKGTLTGSFMGAPAGIAITGSAIIHQLIDGGVQGSVAIWSVAALRWGTVGFAVFLGLTVAVVCRRALRALVSDNRAASQGHFDELASGYAEELPPHVRDRLIETKSNVLLNVLKRHGVPPGGRGLDIGCGQAWYLARIAQEGYAMTGCDLTPGQIKEAEQYCAALKIGADLRVASAEQLPFADAAFDFAYAINVLHHITDPTAFDRSMREIVRVLKPGAPLVVVEMNTLNPLFRLYLSYLYPFVRNIDDGTEVWLVQGRWPKVEGAEWNAHVDYITFLPDFLPRILLKPLSKIEAWLERSVFRRFSAHFAVCLVKKPGNPPS